MAITSSSTQADVVGQYLDNCAYDHNASVSSAKLFVEACRALLVLHPSDWQGADSRIAFNPALWKEQMSEAQGWLNANDTSAGVGNVTHLKVGSDFR